MSSDETVGHFNLQPDPRVLPMLGEINLSQWRCLAELVDNSIDGFLNANRGGKPIAAPEVQIVVPSSGGPDGQVIVRDNGPGMDPPTLQKAVSAGWTGNDPIQNLGMFGMGFNIATARLGRFTRVWTTAVGDLTWHGLEIDFDRLMRQRSFLTPRLSRSKADRQESGTEIIIERIKPEQLAFFARGRNHSELRRELGSAYSAMLRPNGAPISFRLVLQDAAVLGTNHCIWGGEGNPERAVDTASYGTISAYQPLDFRLPNRLFCTNCWHWVPSAETACPACGSAENVVSRVRRVHGWLGIQRVLDRNDYGLDFIRHGRKIEVASKDLFYWEHEGTRELEYPIDDMRPRGRIVGEVHVDHCRVMYTKDRFDRGDPAWEEMVRLVRGEGPLRPDVASKDNFGRNTSPLSLLFQAFRRSVPHNQKMPGGWARLLVFPDESACAGMHKRFEAGDPEYQTDAKWWDLIQAHERSLLAGGSQSTDHSGTLQGWDSRDEAGPADEGGNDKAPTTPSEPSPPPPPRIPMPALSREYVDEETHLRWKVKTFAVEDTDVGLPARTCPWALRAEGPSGYDFLVNPSHEVFRSFTMTPLDALLSQLAWQGMDFQRGNPSPASFASVLASLRGKYGGPNSLDPSTLAGEAATALNTVARSVSRSLQGHDGRTYFQELGLPDREATQRRMASRAPMNPQQVIAEGRFLEFAPRKALLGFVEHHPEMFFDGRHWDASYSTLEQEWPTFAEEAKKQVLRYYLDLLEDAMWLELQDAADLSHVSRSRLARAALAIDLLAAAPEGDSQ